MKILGAIALSLAMFSSMSANAEEEVLRVAIEGTSEPFVIPVKDSDEYIGYDIDLINEVAKKAGYDRIEFVDMPFDGLMPSVITEQVDVAISMITITEERAQIVDFIGPYFDTGLDIMVNSEYKNVIKSVKNVEGRTVCVKLATTCEEYAKKIANVNLLQFLSEKEVFDGIENNKCEALVTNEPIIQYYMKTNDKDGKFYRLGKKLTHANFGIMVSKGRPDINKRITKALNKVMKTKYFKEIYEKWFSSSAHI